MELVQIWQVVPATGMFTGCVDPVGGELVMWAVPTERKWRCCARAHLLQLDSYEYLAISDRCPHGAGMLVVSAKEP